jgi:hypothetical protein
VRFIAGSALERSPMCARSLLVRSITHNYLEFPRRKCEAMAARATRTSRADEACARSLSLGSSVPSALNCTSRG